MNKHVSQFAIVAVVAMATLVTPRATAQVSFAGVGAAEMFNTFGFAARLNSAPCGTHNWSKKNGASAHDSRSSSISDSTGNIWIVWDNSTAPTVICAYLSLDATLGNRAFFAVPTNTLVLQASEVGTNGDQLVPTPMPADEPLPAAVQAALNGQPFNAALTTIRPEDALFATNRALAPLTANRSGLGYGPPPIGIPIQSAFSSKSALPVLFALSGTDPISGLPARTNYVTTNIGATPVVVFVNRTNATTGHLGNRAFSNLNRFVLASVLNGNLTRTRNLTTAKVTTSVGIHVILREPLSGIYNVVEFTVPNSVEGGTSQEIGVDPSVNNPLNISYASGGSRQRAIGTAEEVSEVGAITDSLGYASWSFGNFAGVVSTTKYLAVDSVDPIKSTYSNGVFPTCPSPPCTGALTFPNVQNGTYPLWTILRIVTASPVPSGIQTLINAALANSTTIPDFVPASQLKVFRSHFNQAGVNGSNGLASACSTTESGGDVGGAVFTVQANADFCSDTGVEILQQKQ